MSVLYEPPLSTLVHCPFNPNHHCSKLKFHTHLRKCRWNWKVNALRKGCQLSTFTCQYNPNHVLFEPELKWHEQRCENKENNPKPEIINGACHFDMVFGQDDYGEEFLIREVIHPEGINLLRLKLQEQVEEHKEQRKRLEKEMTALKASMSEEEWMEYKYWNSTKYRTAPKAQHLRMGFSPDREWGWGTCQLPLSKKEMAEWEKKYYVMMDWAD